MIENSMEIRQKIKNKTIVVVVVWSPSLTLHNPMDCSTPGFPVPHRLLEFALTSCPLNQ